MTADAPQGMTGTGGRTAGGTTGTKTVATGGTTAATGMTGGADTESVGMTGHRFALCWDSKYLDQNIFDVEIFEMIYRDCVDLTKQYFNSNISGEVCLEHLNIQAALE